jgi:hypothetical protein
MSVEATVEPTTTAQPPAAVRAANPRIYVFMAAFFAVVTIIGFAPRSSAILSGEMPTPPLIVHVHAALMVLWLLLFLIQSSLMSLAQGRLHQSLGLVSFALVPIMVAMMVAVTIAGYGPATTAGFGDFVSNLLLVQIQNVILFPLFFVWAVLTRRTDSQTHKRMMVLATLVLVGAATGRVLWLPGNILAENSYDWAPWYNLILLAPALLYDLVRYGRVHRAYVIGVGLFVLLVIPVSVLWSTAWWLRTAPVLMGVDG